MGQFYEIIFMALIIGYIKEVDSSNINLIQLIA